MAEDRDAASIREADLEVGVGDGNNGIFTIRRIRANEDLEVNSR